MGRRVQDVPGAQTTPVQCVSLIPDGDKDKAKGRGHKTEQGESEGPGRGLQGMVSVVPIKLPREQIFGGQVGTPTWRRCFFFLEFFLTEGRCQPPQRAYQGLGRRHSSP